MLVRIAFALATLFTVTLFAADLAHAGYDAPRDFAGHRWHGELSEFTGLELLGADIVELRGGRQVLAEYRVPSDVAGFATALVRRASFLFCGNQRRPGFCGVVLRFDDRYDGNFELIVGELTARHGEPLIEDAQFPVARYVWGSKGRHAVAPAHAAAITLTFEPRTAQGEVIYATPDLYRLAYRIHAYGDPDYVLYHRLEGARAGGGAPQGRGGRARCAGNGSCTVERRPVSEEDLAVLQPRR